MIGWVTLAAAAIVWVYMTGWWLVSLVARRSDIADTAWGLGFVSVAVAGAAYAGSGSPRMLLVTFLVTMWGVRLALHISTRRRGGAEDFRYRRWREQWGRAWVVRSYLQVFLLQGVFMVLIAAPVMVAAAARDGGIGTLEIVGALVSVAGISIEAAADAQLVAFKRDPANRGAIMDRGLWSWSRHPNYFGETVTWWGMWMVVLGAPWGWAAVIGPVTITLLLLKVSGVPLLEKHYEGNAAYAKYAARTSVFVPWPPRRG